MRHADRIQLWITGLAILAACVLADTWGAL
jgi:hypothetical protein